MITPDLCDRLTKRLKITVTKKDIEEHWNGSVLSCPIHYAMARKGVTARIRDKSFETESTDGQFSRRAAAFSTAQCVFEGKKSRAKKKKALEVLKPFSFFVTVPEEDIKDTRK